MVPVCHSVSLIRAAPLCLALLSLSGCMHARVEESRSLPTQIGSQESIVVLAKPQVEGAAAEDRFMDCLSRNLSRGQRSIKVHENDAFVDRMFPWFEPGTAPTKAEAVTALLERPGVTERIAETGVRYVVWLDGATRKTDGGGSLACGAAPGAAGCIGFGWWEKESDYEATIWDLQQARSAGTVGTNVTGTSAIVGAVIPIPFIARVEGTACNRLSEQLRGFFTGGGEPPTAVIAPAPSTP